MDLSTENRVLPNDRMPQHPFPMAFYGHKSVVPVVPMPPLPDLRAGFEKHERNDTGWWLTYPSEKYEFVNEKDDIPYMKWKVKNVPNHQPGYVSDL